MSTATLETAIIVAGVDGALAICALVYVVRRVTPWPKPPAPAQPRKQPGTPPEVTG